MPSGKQVFVTQDGVQYMLERYLTSNDVDELRKLNTPHSRGLFEDKLVQKLEKGSGSSRWIPPNYRDELVENAGAIIGTAKSSRSLKTKKKNVDVYQTRSGQEVYEDDHGNVRDYKTGRFVKKKVFED